MRTKQDTPHSDDLEPSLAHFNESFRFRYHLRPLNRLWLDHEEFWDEWDAIPAIRADGVADAPCAVLAKFALRATPVYALGFLDPDGTVHVQAPVGVEDEAYRGGTVLLVNPIGGYDNWKEVARWVRTVGSTKARRTRLAGLASERRPDYESIDRRLEALPEDERAQVLPGDEGFSRARAAEVSYIYGVPVERLRAWKQTHRRERASGKAGRPRNS